MSNPYRNARRDKARQRANLDTGESHRQAIRAAAVRGIAALDDKSPAGIVDAIAGGRVPYVTLKLHEDIQ